MKCLVFEYIHRERSPPEELEVAGERDVWASLLRLEIQYTEML